MLSAPCYNKDNYREFIFKIYVQKSIELLFFSPVTGVLLRGSNGNSKFLEVIC